MAAQLQLSRNTHVYASDGTNFWELPVLDGFSFSQSTATTEVSVSEMADLTGVSRRGRRMFTDAFEPAEWNLQMYARPFTASSLGNHTDEVLWANFVNAGTYTSGTRIWADPITNLNHITKATNTSTIDFDDSNVSALGTFTLYFVLGACGTAPASYSAGPGQPQTIYRISGAVCNTVTMDFDIDGILTLDWSGLGSLLEEIPAMPSNWHSAIIADGIPHNTNNFIRNRLTTLAVTIGNTDQDSDTTTGDADGDGGASTLGDEFMANYALTLTGGSITFENNLTYLTPEELCVVNQPLGNVTGNRSVSGSFTCYLNSGTSANTATTGTSADLFDDLASAVNVVTNSMDLVFSIGGATSPKLVIDIPTAHLEIPTHQIEDVIGLEVNFHALPSSLDATNEATIAYHAV